MQLGGQRSSGNVEDRRGMGMAAGGLGIGGVVIALIAMFFGVDPAIVTDIANQAAPRQTQQVPAQKSGPPDEGQVFVSKVLGSTEDVWQQIFKASGSQYREPKLVLFSGATQSACGLGQAAMGPFYCPADERLYIDLDFLAKLQAKLRAEGDFAAAYVIAHEVGHHIQKITGIMDRTQRQGASRGDSNRNSVLLELQADCFAGVWGHHAGQRNLLDKGDIEEGINAAGAVGDDRLQGRSGAVRPESFTHGTSAQRSQWFRRGLESGKPSDCDTFAGGAR
jgi:predicted metalloprotease